MKDDAEERLKKIVSLAYWFISILRWILGIACMELNQEGIEGVLKQEGERLRPSNEGKKDERGERKKGNRREAHNYSFLHKYY